MAPEKNASLSLEEALRTLLTSRKESSQESICAALEAQGYPINQSKASRLLRKVGAIKVASDSGQIVYCLPREPVPPAMESTLKHLIIDIVANETLIVIYTSPGSASMIARVLDYYQAAIEILGTLAGDDTIFVAPKSVKNTQKLFEKIKDILLGPGLDK